MLAACGLEVGRARRLWQKLMLKMVTPRILTVGWREWNRVETYSASGTAGA